MEELSKQTCACCFAKYGVRSTKLKDISSSIADKIRMFIWPSFDIEICNQPKRICKNCERNLYKLAAGQEAELSQWMDNISKVNGN